MELHDQTWSRTLGAGAMAAGVEVSPRMGASDVIGAAPWSDHGPYTDEALLDPWSGYKQLHDAGPASDGAFTSAI
ncbi:MAG TPA: hypothetical protein VGO30_04920 [Mycobacterium sp.]|jgi:hypothetical protein|nr:hypothetical protein [Mycobacterium sp.]